MDALTWLNAASAEDARAAFSRCCGASAWIEAMVAGRPHASAESLHDRARAAWRQLTEGDWLEAFSHHPRIGDLEAMRSRFAGTWSAGEQGAAAGAGEATLRALVEGNRAYEERFGHIFIVCATGRSAEEMLAMLRARLGNAPPAELRIAASEQEKITALRLDKLLAEGAP